MIFLIALLSVPIVFSTHEHVDAIELNHSFDARGRLIYDQLIFWERIVSRLFRESWTQIDPEREDKSRHPESLRIELVKRKRVDE